MALSFDYPSGFLGPNAIDQFIKEKITDEIVTKQMKIVEEELRKDIKTLLEKYTTRAIENSRDHMDRSVKFTVIFHHKEYGTTR